jgi:hypothetical protein
LAAPMLALRRATSILGFWATPWTVKRV